jgi:glucan biosynthesis protein C
VLRAWQVVVFAVALGLISYAWRILVPVGAVVLGIPSAAYLPQYVALFVVGVFAVRRGWFTNLPGRSGFLGAAMIVSSVVPMALGGYEALQFGEAAPAPGSFAHLAFAMWDQLFAVGMMLILLTLFQRRVTASGRFAQFLATNAYAVYLIHAPLIVGFVALLAPFQPSPLLGFATVLPLSLVTSWLLAAGLRRLPGARATL